MRSYLITGQPYGRYLSPLSAGDESGCVMSCHAPDAEGGAIIEDPGVWHLLLQWGHKGV